MPLRTRNWRAGLALAALVLPGQGAWVKVTVLSEPLFIRWRDHFLQLISNSSRRSKWI